MPNNERDWCVFCSNPVKYDSHEVSVAKYCENSKFLFLTPKTLPVNMKV